MFLRDDQVIGLPVLTTAGERVGRLVGFVMDSESGIVVQYRVRPPGFLAALLPGASELLIHQSQVVSIDSARMVVESGHTLERSGGKRRRALASSPHPQPLTSEPQ